MDSKLDDQRTTLKTESFSVPWLETLDIPFKYTPEILMFFARFLSPGLEAKFKLKNLVAQGKSILEANYQVISKAKEAANEIPKLYILYTIEGGYLYINSISWDDLVGKWEISHYPISLSSLNESSLDKNGIPVVINLIHSHLRGLNNAEQSSQFTLEQRHFVILDSDCINSCFDHMIRSNFIENLNAIAVLVNSCPKSPKALQIHQLIVDHCLAEAKQDVQFRYMSTLQQVFKVAHNSFYRVAENEFHNENIEKALRCLKICAKNGYYFRELAEKIFKAIELQARDSKSSMTLDKPSMDSDTIQEILINSSPLVFIRTATALGKTYIKGREEQLIANSLGKNGIFTPDNQTIGTGNTHQGTHLSL
ncbi:hypothetical protein [Legionella waltersii]|uniref:Uncharacterized protein n=1 Tax=Legionella waltersii TaxID=66969 RepID=A0A0W1AND8_9GAMM|nr:hypothetical protein [Legionella waltersii]KTD82859.1 hypothetical protein Lwal_0337 [Legionella waltersii]SNV01872.1 Uncharacterised protein [Legionella waltersii]